jgi:signal transduction histidine kinase
MLTTIVETIAGALKLPYAAIRVDGQGLPTGLIETGSVAGEPVHVALVYHGEANGELVLGRRGQAEPFGPADRRLLDDLARQAAAAVHMLRLANDLQRSRHQLVTAREEERRRLRRDLHDGLGPTLAALGLKLETARSRAAHDAQVDALLTELAQHARAAVGDVRRLVYGLRPPALDELGLVGAIYQLSAAVDPDGPRVTVETDGSVRALPAAVEVAAYRITQEALTNAVRHAVASACAIRLDYMDSALRVEIRDNGIGLPSSRPAGVGLRSMRERAEELGGAFALDSHSPGGTVVRIVLPLIPEAVA